MLSEFQYFNKSYYFQQRLGMQRQYPSNKNFRSYQPQMTINAVCLNPDCLNFTRFCKLMPRNVSPHQVDSAHTNCKGMILPLDPQTQLQKQQRMKGLEKEDPDFLKETITSIQILDNFSKSNWRGQVSKIFTSIQQQINNKLQSVFKKTCQKIQTLLFKNAMISVNIKQLAKLSQNKLWTLKHQNIYRQNIQQNLRQIRNVGILKIMNAQALGRQIDLIKEHADRIQWCLWVPQSELQLNQRSNSFRYQQKLRQMKQQNTMDGINRNLQQIHSALKLKQFTFKQRDSSLCIQCDRCNYQIVSNSKNKQAKRSQCLLGLLQHLCTRHSQQIIQKVIAKSNKSSQKINYDQFLRQISTSNAKTYLVIDRQNVNNTDGQAINCQGVYSIQVVSKGRQNLASGKYLVAQSTGKDAADILIIIALYELTRLAPTAQVVLLTNDHFGKTLQPIFEERGIKIQLTGRYSSQLLKQMNNQSEYIIIEQ